MIDNPQNLAEQLQNLDEAIIYKLKEIIDALATKQPTGDYATTTEVSAALEEGLATKLGKTEKATSASTADSATKATQDANGNVINTTYATKTELTSTQETLQDSIDSKQPTGDYATNSALTQGLKAKVDTSTYTEDKATFLTKTEASTTYLGKTAKAESAKVADKVDGANVTGTVANATNAVNATNATTATTATNNILKSGARGSLAGSETVSILSGNQTITKDSADTIVMSTSGAVTLTFTPAGTSDCAVKIISLTATEETALTISGAVWANLINAPVWGTAGKHLTLVAYFINGRVIINVFDNDED